MNSTRKREESLRDEFEEGFTLVEAMVALIVVSVLFLMSVSAIGAIRDSSASEAVVTAVQALTAEARGRAICQNASFGIVFSRDGDGVLARLYRDGDGDGVNRDDIERGTDFPAGPSERLAGQFCAIEVPFGADKDPGGRKLEGSDAVRFGRGDILTFSPKATATPGTLYISEGVAGNSGWAVRVVGIDGRIKVYRFRKGEWREIARW